MSFRDAQQYIGLNCEVAWRDRHGEVQTKNLFVLDVNFVPLYGICLITDFGEIRLDRVVSIASLEQSVASEAA